jgi:signal peptide peptidase SppA
MSSSFLSHLSGSVFASPQHANLIETNLRAMAAHPAFAEVQKPSMYDDDFWPPEEGGEWARALRPYTVVDGVLQIPIRGVLLHDFPYQFFGWATGYRYIEKAFQRGMDDTNVRGIAFIIDSPGGSVAGCFDAVDRMLEAREGNDKPVRAFAAELACSAAYAMAIVADSITVSRTGYVGSVGVVTSHMDVSKLYEEMGVKITFIHAGKHKVEGNSFEPLSDEAKNRIQAHVDELYSTFVAYVAANRGLEEQAVRDTEALVFSASESIGVGFADSIGKLDEEMAEWSAALETDAGDYTMSTKTPAADGAATLTQADLDAAKVSGRQEGAAAERERVTAILTSPEATGRESTAQHLALKTNQTAEEAVALLTTLPKAEAAKPAPEKQKGAKGLDARMEDDPAPGITADVEDDDNDEPTPDAKAAKILRASGRVPGKNPRKK